MRIWHRGNRLLTTHSIAHDPIAGNPIAHELIAGDPIARRSDRTVMATMRGAKRADGTKRTDGAKRQTERRGGMMKTEVSDAPDRIKDDRIGKDRIGKDRIGKDRIRVMERETMHIINEPEFRAGGDRNGTPRG